MDDFPENEPQPKNELSDIEEELVVIALTGKFAKGEHLGRLDIKERTYKLLGKIEHPDFPVTPGQISGVIEGLLKGKYPRYEDVARESKEDLRKIDEALYSSGEYSYSLNLVGIAVARQRITKPHGKDASIADATTEFHNASAAAQFFDNYITFGGQDPELGR